MQLVERYTKEQHLFRTDDGPTPKFTKVLSLDLGTIEPSLAGPKRPQDRVPLRGDERVVPQGAASADRRARFRPRRGGRRPHGQRWSTTAHPPTIGHGAVVIAAITSCTNTSNPAVMLAAGLLAKKAVERGLHVKLVREDQPRPRHPRRDRLSGQGRPDRAARHSSASTPSATAARPASATAARCRTRWPRPSPKAIWSPRPCSSGNRNFEGRINPLVKANYLASPPLVVAYALAGTIDIDLTTEPLGTGSDGRPVYLEGHLAHARRKSPQTVEAVRAAGDVPQALRQRLRRPTSSGTSS